MKTLHQVLVNPFQPGESVKVPAGATFSTDDRRWDRFNHVSDRGFTAKKVEYIMAGGVTHLNDEPFPYAGQIAFIAARGYMKYVHISEEILHANNKPIEYVTVEHTPLSEQ